MGSTEKAFMYRVGLPTFPNFDEAGGRSMKDWEHPAISSGKTFWAYEVGLLGFLTVLFVVAALENQSNELWLFAAGAAVLTILSGFFAKWQIKQLRHEYRYEDDASAEPAAESRPGS